MSRLSLALRERVAKPQETRVRAKKGEHRHSFRRADESWLAGYIKTIIIIFETESEAKVEVVAHTGRHENGVRGVLLQL